MIKVSDSILIVARPDRWREALRALLTAVPQLKMVRQTDNSSTALQIVTEYHPTLILLDANVLAEGMGAILRQIKATHPRTRCIILADNSQQQQAATVAGADDILLRGFPTGKLLAIIEQQLSQREI